MSLEGSDDGDPPSPPTTSLPAQASALEALGGKKLTKARRKALKNGVRVGPARKNGETDFVGKRKEIFDLHLQQYPHDGTKHPVSHWVELEEAFDKAIPWRLQWNQEPPNDAQELAHLQRPAEANEVDLEKSQRAFNYRKLRNFYYRQGVSTSGTKAVFKSVAKNLRAPTDARIPHRRADYQHYALMPQYNEKVEEAFREQHPDPSMLGRKRVNERGRIARDLFLNETDEVKASVLADLNAEHSKKLKEYKTALLDKPVNSENFTEDQKLAAREHFADAMVPLMDEVERMTGLKLVLHGARIAGADENGKPKLEMKSLMSGLKADGPNYTNFKVSDPKSSALMARSWGGHVYRMYAIENGIELPTDQDDVQPVSNATQTQASAEASSSKSSRRRGPPSRTSPIPRAESDDEVDEGSVHVPVDDNEEDQQRLEQATARGLPPPPRCENPVLLNHAEQEELGRALNGLGIYDELFNETRYPRHFPLPDEQFDDLPALHLSEYRHRIGPLTRAWICNPNLELNERRNFVSRTHKMSEDRLAKEEAELDDGACWTRVKKAANRRRMLDVASWGGSDAAEGSKKKRKRRAAKSDDDDYESDSHQDGPDGGRKQGKASKKRGRRGAAKSNDDGDESESNQDGADGGRKQGKRKKQKTAKAPMPSLAKKSYPKPKKLLASKKPVVAKKVVSWKDPVAEEYEHMEVEQGVEVEERMEVEEQKEVEEQMPAVELVEEPLSITEQMVIEEALENANVDQHSMPPGSNDKQDVTLTNEDDNLDAWVGRNPNLVNRDAKSALLSAFNTEYDDDALLDFVMQTLDDKGDESDHDELNNQGVLEQIDDTASGTQRDASDTPHDEPKRARAAKTKAFTDLTDLYTKYPTPASSKSTSQNARLAIRKPIPYTEYPRTHEDMLARGMQVVFKTLKDPEWATKGRDWLLGLVGGGKGWEPAVQTWYSFERRFHFGEPDMPRPPFIWSTDLRPSEVSYWVSVARPPRLVPAIKNLKGEAAVHEFGKRVSMWWCSVNPDWRKPKKGPMRKDVDSKDWFSIFWPGPNGFFAIFACLYWWRAAAMQGVEVVGGRCSVRD
uniref:Uncharacterized protein n=1 Tax=Mycena chlorophos TaxID=658473 RepID=A0ABQ0KUH0_MYCCL|nr:predicted protein [Mycena chlorophos]